jgi:glycosyltransferase involved in cell wall biosynthesis
VDRDDVHVALLNVNAPLFTAPLGDDAAVLRQLGERVEQITVVVATRSPYEPLALAGNVRVIAAPAPGRLRGIGAMMRALRAAGEVDLIQAQECMYTGLAGLLARRGTRAKLTVGVFGSDPADPGFARASRAHRAAALVGRAVLRRVDMAQTDSRFTEAQLARRGIPVRYKPMTPLNIDTFLSAFARREHREQAGQILFVGRLGRQKRLPLLLESVARVPNARLTLVGDGPDRAALERQAAALGIQAEFRGHVPHTELVAEYLAADVLAMSSHYEGMPRAFMEAGATGLPIVSTAVAGARELEAAAPVWIAPPEPDGFAATLRAALGDAAARRRCGEALHEAMRARQADVSPPDQQVAIWAELRGRVPTVAADGV